jgi:hypothetical protein
MEVSQQQELAFEYARRPVSTIKLLIEADKTSELEKLLQKNQFYPFLSDFVIEWLDRDPSPSIDRASTLLDEIIRAVIGSMTIDDLSSMLTSVAPLRNDGMMAASDIASVLREFKLSMLAGRFVGDELLTQEAADQRLRGIQPTKQSDTTPDYNEFLSELKAAGVVLPATTKTVKPASKPAAPKREPKVTESKAAEQLSPEATELPAKPLKPEEPVANRNSRTTIRATATPKRSVESYLSPDARTKIMSKVFRDDQEDYDRSIQLIDKAKDWKQASIYLDALFMRRKVDPYSKTAVRLTDAVYARFNN